MKASITLLGETESYVILEEVRSPIYNGKIRVAHLVAGFPLLVGCRIFREAFNENEDVKDEPVHGPSWANRTAVRA